MKSITTEIINNYNELKNKMDAAYIVFKKTPSAVNATKHITATQAFNNFCVETMTTLAGASEDSFDKDAEILANIDQYKTCKKCKAEILHQVDKKHFIGSSNFVPDFPGWCHECLVEHCVSCDCSECIITPDKDKCSYAEIKKLYLDA